MPQVYEPQKGDSEEISLHLKNINTYSDKILIRQYNRMVKLGLMDIHTQKLYVLSLRIAFLNRFNKSPIIFEDNVILRLSGEIEME